MSVNGRRWCIVILHGPARQTRSHTEERKPSRYLETQILSQQRHHHTQPDDGDRTMVLLQRGDDVTTSRNEVDRPKNAAHNAETAGRAKNRAAGWFRGDSWSTKSAPILVALARTRFPLVLILLWRLSHAQTLPHFLRKFN